MAFCVAATPIEVQSGPTPWRSLNSPTRSGEHRRREYPSIWGERCPIPLAPFRRITVDHRQSAPSRRRRWLRDQSRPRLPGRKRSYARTPISRIYCQKEAAEYRSLARLCLSLHLALRCCFHAWPSRGRRSRSKLSSYGKNSEPKLLFAMSVRRSLCLGS
jgi:hypothetical protein